MSSVSQAFYTAFSLRHFFLAFALHPWLNLLFLNFGYHNAHHHNMSCPWHELPELHQKLYTEKGGGLLPLPQLVSNYHHFRLYRLFSGQGDATFDENTMPSSFTGGIGVSFLTPP